MLPDGTIGTALDRARTNRLPGTPFNGAKLPHLVVCALPESHEFAVPVVGMRRSNSAWDATFLLAHSSIAGRPESNRNHIQIQLRSRRLIGIAPVPCIITATFVMCGSAACNATKCGRSSGPGKKNLTPEQEQRVWGDSSTGTAIDADTTCCVTHCRSGCRSKSANSLI